MLRGDTECKSHKRVRLRSMRAISATPRLLPLDAAAKNSNGAGTYNRELAHAGLQVENIAYDGPE